VTWPHIPTIVVDVDPDARNYTQRALFLEHCVAEAMRLRHHSTVQISFAAPAPPAVERWAGQDPPSPWPAELARITPPEGL
jgi:hypothetical protein